MCQMPGQAQGNMSGRMMADTTRAVMSRDGNAVAALGERAAASGRPAAASAQQRIGQRPSGSSTILGGGNDRGPMIVGPSLTEKKTLLGH